MVTDSRFPSTLLRAGSHRLTPVRNDNGGEARADANESIDPSDRKGGGPQDDSWMELRGDSGWRSGVLNSGIPVVGPRWRETADSLRLCSGQALTGLKPVRNDNSIFK